MKWDSNGIVPFIPPGLPFISFLDIQSSFTYKLVSMQSYYNVT